MFSQLPEEEFIEAITSRLHSDHRIYRTMARDIHQAGTVLQKKKYRMLGYAYRTLLAGLVASFLAYVVLYVSPNPALALEGRSYFSQPCA